MPRRFILGGWLHYRLFGEIGAGVPPIILLHHGFGHADGWERFPEALRRATGRSVLAYSRAGCGRSEPGREARGVDYLEREACDTLPALMASFGLDRACLYGHSDGATIALIAAARRPGLVEAVIAEAPHVLVEPRTIEGARALRQRSETDPAFRRKLSRSHDDPHGAFRAWSDIWLSPSFADWTIAPLLPAIRAPLLLLQGDADPFGSDLHVKLAHDAAAGPVTTHLLPGCGHAPHRAEPRIPGWGAALLERQPGQGGKSWLVGPSVAEAPAMTVSWT
ncbi:MAG: alpha/beta fold hydrolase [Beijerinckiaceae bacterium]